MEPRRVEMVTFAEENVPKSEKVEPTIRFTLTLTESNDETCPEFSYAELWKNALDEKEQDENDPFSRNDRAEEDKMAALAKSFEAKYGAPPARKKSHRRSDRMQDLVDLGDGYDETDPFVDNSEAYDELVPASVTTKHGGFYINAGCLDFRALSDDSADAFKEQKHRKKHRILSDSESEVAIKKRGRPKKKKLLEGTMGEEMKKRKWKRLATASDAAKNFIRRKKLKAKELASAAQALSAPSPPVVGQNGLSHPRKILDSSSDNDSALPFAVETLSTLDPETSAKYESVIDSVISQASPEEVEEKRMVGTEESVSKLPTPLSESLLDAIVKIKQAAKESAEGKCKFFNLRVNELLLQIENESRQLACGLRMSIYSHLAGHLPCGKETLVKRAKKLRLNQQDHKLREPLARLREAVSHVMPALLEKHQAECLATTQAKERMSETKEKIEGVREGVSTESEEDGERSQDGMGERQKRIVAPRRKFEWNAEIRHLLCNVVRIKMECFELSKIRSQNPEEYLRAFLDAEVKHLWPQGWMQTRMLFKETRCVHVRWTNPALIKQKKSLLLPTTTKLNIQAPGGASISEPLHIFTSPVSAATTSSAAPMSKTNEWPPGGGKCEEAEEKSSPLRSAPTLLDYACQSFLSTARSKVLSSGANESNSDAGMPSPSMPRLKPEKPVAPPDRRVLAQDAFLDHFTAFTQQQLINKAKSLIKPGAVTNIPQGGTNIEKSKVAPPAVSAHAAEYIADQTDKHHVTPAAPSGGANSTSTKTSPTNLPRVMSPTSVSPLRNITLPKQAVLPADHFVAQKDLPHGDQRLSSAELANLLLMAGNKPKQTTPPLDHQTLLSPKDMEYVSERISSAEIANLLKNAVNKRQMSATTSQREFSTGPTEGSTRPQVSTSQVKLAAVLGSNTISRLQQPQQQGYLSGERAVSGQLKGGQGTDLKHRSPSGQRSPIGVRQTEQLTSIIADAKFTSGPLRWPSEGGQCHEVRDMVLTSGEKKQLPVIQTTAKMQRQGNVGHDQVSHGVVAPPSGVARQALVPMQRSHSQELSSMVAPSGGAERQSPVVSSSQLKRRSSVSSYGQEMRLVKPPGGMERHSSVSPVATSQSGVGVNREHRTSLDRRRLSLTPPTSASSQRSQVMFSSPSSPRQQHGCDRLSHISGTTTRQQQQPSYGGLSLTEAHQQVLAVNQNSYIKQALSMAPPESRPNHVDKNPMSLNSSTCSSPLYWSTPLSHPVIGSPRTSLPTPVFTPSGLASDRGASNIATTAAMFSLPGDMPPRSSVGYLGLNQLTLPKASPPRLSHPSQQHPAMHLNGSPEQITGNNMFGHASTPHGSPLSVHNAQGMTSPHGGVHCFSPRHPPPPSALLSFGNPFSVSDPNQPQHRY